MKRRSKAPETMTSTSSSVRFLLSKPSGNWFSWAFDMYYDLHIHSGLSPCADDDMSPQNIIQMAKLKGLDLISICDHNSLKQQAVMAEVAQAHHLNYLYGIELQTKEEVHILAYFKDPSELPGMQAWDQSCSSQSHESA